MNLMDILSRDYERRYQLERRRRAGMVYRNDRQRKSLEYYNVKLLNVFRPKGSTKLCRDHNFHTDEQNECQEL